MTPYQPETAKSAEQSTSGVNATRLSVFAAQDDGCDDRLTPTSPNCAPCIKERSNSSEGRSLLRRAASTDGIDAMVCV